MNTADAFLRGEAARRAGNEARVFDWKKAALLIVENNITNASAGLREDWEWTGGFILRGGKPVKQDDTYTYLASIWATPILRDDDSDEEYECWAYKADTEWDENSFWPEVALNVLADASVQ